jgi:hypothetical protein
MARKKSQATKACDFDYLAKMSLITSPAMIRPTTEGTKALLPGT